MKKVITITVDTDYPTDKIMNALLDALYEARFARGADYVYRSPAYQNLTPEEFDAKIDATNAKREFYLDAHRAVCDCNIEEVDGNCEDQADG